jgi:hypothetical protein
VAVRAAASVLPSAQRSLLHKDKKAHNLCAAGRKRQMVRAATSIDEPGPRGVRVGSTRRGLCGLCSRRACKTINVAFRTVCD